MFITSKIAADSPIGHERELMLAKVAHNPDSAEYATAVTYGIIPMNATFKGLVPEPWQYTQKTLQFVVLQNVRKYYDACMTYKLFDSKFSVWISAIMNNTPCMLGRNADWRLNDMATSVWYDAGLNELEHKNPRHQVLGFIVFCVWMSVCNDKKEARSVVENVVGLYAEHAHVEALVDGHPTFICDDVWANEFNDFSNFYLHYSINIHHDYRLLTFTGPYVDYELEAYALRWKGKSEGLRPWRRHSDVYNHLMYKECSIDAMHDEAKQDPEVVAIDQADSEAVYAALAIKIMAIATRDQAAKRHFDEDRVEYMISIRSHVRAY
jgi:hypothetical protein